MHERARSRDAGLSRGGENAREQPGLRLLQVGVVEDDVGALAAKLQRDMGEAGAPPTTATARPASTPPVKAILATSVWLTSASDVARSPVTTLSTPFGNARPPRRAAALRSPRRASLPTA